MIEVVEYAIFGVVIALNFGLGLYLSLRRKARAADTTTEMFLGSRALRSLPLAASLVASSVSSVTFVGFTGHFYAYGFHLMWYSLNTVAMTPVVAFLFLPVFYGLRVTSVFEGAGISTLLMVGFQLVVMWQSVQSGAKPPPMPVTLEYCPENVTTVSNVTTSLSTPRPQSTPFRLSSFWSCLISTCATVILGVIISLATGEHKRPTAKAKHLNQWFVLLWQKLGLSVSDTSNCEDGSTLELDVKLTWYQRCALWILQLCPIPRHVVVMPDGHRRYSRRTSSDLGKSYNKGLQNSIRVCRLLETIGVTNFTALLCSNLNFKRSAPELQALFSAFGLRLSRGPARNQTVPSTLKCAVTVCIAYSSRHEITRMVKDFACAVKEGRMHLQDITAGLIEDYLTTCDGPDAQLWYRSAGEVRFSDILLLQNGYSYMHVEKKQWPSINHWDLLLAIIQFQNNWPTIRCPVSGRRSPYQGQFTKEMRTMQQAILKRHNHYRRLHGVPPLRKDEKLNRIAQGWAQHMADIGDIAHLDKKGIGENVYSGSSGHPSSTAKGIVDFWYSEICTYYYPNLMPQGMTGHYTQIVWKATRRIGTGFARGSNGDVYVASFYAPGGNWPGGHQENVPEPIAGRPSRRKCRAMK
ncbi:hypothetical protein MTO96_013722 [Rhipicephalus appendiculatus]